jgi:hypothetical protein
VRLIDGAVIWGCRQALSGFPGVKVVDDPSTKKYPMPLTATSKYDVEVSDATLFIPAFRSSLTRFELSAI